MTLRDIGILLGYDIDKSSEQKAEDSIKSLKSMATKLLGAIGIGFSLTQMNALAEEFNGINDKINYAVKGLADQKEAQEAILKAANDTKSSYEAMAGTVTNLIKADTNLFSVDEAVSFSSAVTKLLKTAGRGDNEISSMMDALNKSFQKGAVETDTLNTMLEQCPEAANLLAEKLGVAKTSLLDMATNGQISCQQLKDAFLSSTGDIDAAFDILDYSISDSLLNVRNKWGYFLDDLNVTFGITGTIAKGIVKMSDVFIGAAQKMKTRLEWVAEKLGGTEKLVKLIGIIAGAAFGVMAIPKLLGFLDGLKKIDKALMGAKLKILAIVAVIVLLALLIEDFMAFMRGDESIIGALFDKAGIGAENARQAIFNAWGTIKDFLLKAWELIRTAAITIFEALSAWWDENGEGVKESFLKIWEAIKSLCIALWKALSATAQSIFKALKVFWDTWGSTIISVFGTIWDTLISLIWPFLDCIVGIINFLTSVFTGDWEGAWTAIKDIAAALWQMITAIVSGAWDVICTIWSKLSEMFGGIFQAAWDIINEKVSGIKDAIVNGLTEAIDWIKSLPAEALQWGADIINAIVSGITGAVGKVGEAVKGVADKIKSFLGFSEPEDGPLSDFHTYMPDMIDLMTQGIQAGEEKVKGAIGKLAQGMSATVQTKAEPNLDDSNMSVPSSPSQVGGTIRMSDVLDVAVKGLASGLTKAKTFLDSSVGAMSAMAKAKVVSPSTAATVGGGDRISKSVVQNVNIQNDFHGDQAGQKKSSDAMDKAAEDSTSELARALAFTR